MSQSLQSNGTMSEKNDFYSVHMYFSGDSDQFLINCVFPLINNLTFSKLIDKYFFVRYNDNGKHIRLRLMPINEDRRFEMINETRNNLILLYSQYKNAPDVGKFYYVNKAYYPEVKRYGGETYIQHAEDFFYTSSVQVMELLMKEQLPIQYSKKMGVAVLMHLIYFLKVTANLNEVCDFFHFSMNNWIQYACDSYRIPKEKVLEIYKERYLNSIDTYTDLVQVIFDFVINKNQSDVPEWCIEWENRVSGFSNLMNLLGVRERKNFNNSPILSWTISDSILHMTNNRLGLKNSDESFIYFLIKEALLNYVTSASRK